MRIRLNGKKTEIKPASNMTVAEYIEFWKQVKEGDNLFRVTLIYLSIVTGLKFGDVLLDEIDNKTIGKINSYCDVPMLVDKMKISKEFYYGFTGQRFTQELNWRAVGVRLLLSQKKKNELELIVYLLSILITGSYDVGKIDETYHRLLQYNSVDVFSFGTFFLRNLQAGSSKETRFSRLLKKIQNIFTRKQ